MAAVLRRHAVMEAMRSLLDPKALDLLEPAIARLMPTYPDNEKVAHMINFDWWADNLPMMQRRFQQWLQS